MKTNLFKCCCLAAAMLLFNACNPDETGVAELNKIEQTSNLQTGPSCEMITFDSFSKDGNGFVNKVTSDMGSEVMVAAYRRTAASTYDTWNVANVFDSGQSWPAGNQIDDILTPNQEFGGGGLGDGGKTGAYQNDTKLGNLLIINRSDSPSPAYDYNSGGRLTFDFSSLGSVTMKSITILDIDSYEAGSHVALYRSGSSEPYKTVQMNVSGSNGVQELDLGNTTGVVKMVVTLGSEGISPNGSLSGSGAIDNIQFCREVSEYGCTRTQGYWKTHSKYDNKKKYDATWAKVGEDTPFFGSGYTYYNIMGVPVQGYGYFNLAHQYVAATLNMKVASAPEDVRKAYKRATEIFSMIPDQSKPTVMITPAQMKADKSLNEEAVRLAGILDAYNNGFTGPGHCD